MKISVLGCGRWGTFIAWYLEKIGHNTVLWGRSSSAHFQELKCSGKNKFLTLSKGIALTDDLPAAVAHAEVIVISISSQALRSFMQELVGLDLHGKKLVLCMKGIEETSGKRLTEVVGETLTTAIPVAIWVGPGHVEDFTRGIPNCMVIDSADEAYKLWLIDELSSELIRFYVGTDLIGNEVGAAAKNVVGIAAGMLDGAGFSSLKGALMSRGTREIARLIKALGGNELSAYGLAHLGDYEATLFSKHSHNRAFGEMFIKGERFEDLAEGVKTTNALLRLGEKYSVELPICRAVHAVIYEGHDPKETISKLFLRSIKREF